MAIAYSFVDCRPGRADNRNFQQFLDFARATPAHGRSTGETISHFMGDPFARLVQRD
jgi:hypothetical protein